MQIRRSRRHTGELDMTPMIDCIFQLLIFFLLSSSFMTPALPMTLPQATITSTSPPQGVIVSLDSEDRVFVNREETTIEELGRRAHEALLESKQTSVVIRADKSVTYERIFRAIESLKIAGVHQMRFAYEQRDP